MKRAFTLLGVYLLFSLANAVAGVLYVNASGVNPVPPYAGWATAATNIQDAVTLAQPGDTVSVTNGAYRFGGLTVFGAMTNRVVLTNGILLSSVNGPLVTAILGGTQMRGVYLGSNSIVSGFTVTNGTARTGGDALKEMSGGGIWCETGGVVTNCVIAGNSAVGNPGGGAGVYGGTLYNCTLTGNKGYLGAGVRAATVWNSLFLTNTGTFNGGGAYGSALYNCTLTNNIMNAYGNGAGAYLCLLSNCVVRANSTTPNGGGASGSGAGTCLGTNYSCTLAGNFSGQSGGGSYQSTNYNCVLSGNFASFQGGGAYQGMLSNCIVSANLAGAEGGGVYGSWGYNCLLNGNSVTSTVSFYGNGGGAHSASLLYCTVTGNSASTSGGGVYNGSHFNCIIYFNSISNWSGTPFMSSSCVTPAPPGSPSIITNDPVFVDPGGGVFQLRCGSPCIDTAGVVAPNLPTDLRGLPRPVDGNSDSITNYDRGAYEYNPAADQTVGIRSVFGLSTFATSFVVPFVAQIGGCAAYFWWDFGDGVTTSNQYNVSHGWTAPGSYNVRLSAYYPALGQTVSATNTVQVVQQPVYYADVSNPSPIPPYTNWATAATSLQQAIAAGTTPGRLVLVTNGVYTGTGLAVTGSLSNSVVLSNAVVLRSVNGPDATVIQPSPTPRRAAFVGSNSFLIGFTLKGGITSFTGDAINDRSGGGLWCEPGGVVSNCIVTGNRAQYHGGGAYQGTFYDCLFTNNSFGFTNSAFGGAVFGGTLYRCTLVSNWTSLDITFGSGAARSTLYNCTVAGNYGSGGGGSGGTGGGAFLSTLYNSTLANNRSDFGGGSASNTLWNCVLTGNIASQGGGSYCDVLYNCILSGNQSYGYGGGAYYSTPYNCTIAGNSVSGTGGGFYAPNIITAYNTVIYSNTATGSGPNWAGSLLGVNCIATPVPTPTSRNLTNDPLFVNLPAGDLHLRFGSPAIDAGTNMATLPGSDLEGNFRPLDGNGDAVAKFDIGAYEFNLVATIGTNWFLDHGLNPNDPLVFGGDPDTDGLTTLQEWIAGTDPTNTLSALQMLSSSNAVTGVTVIWQSVVGKSYLLLRGTNLSVEPPFSLLASNLPGLPDTTMYADTTATNGGPYFYRVGVQP